MVANPSNNMDYFKHSYRQEMNEDKKKVYTGYTYDFSCKLENQMSN